MKDDELILICKPRRNEEGSWELYNVPHEHYALSVTLDPSKLSVEKNEKLRSIESNPDEWALIHMSNEGAVGELRSVPFGKQSLDLQKQKFFEKFKSNYGLKIMSADVGRERNRFLISSMGIVATKKFLFNSMIADPQCEGARNALGGPGSGKTTLLEQLFPQEPGVLLVDNGGSLDRAIEEAAKYGKKLTSILFRCSPKDVGERVLERSAQNPEGKQYDVNYITEEHLKNRRIFQDIFAVHKDTENAQFVIVNNPRTPLEAAGKFDLSQVECHVGSDVVAQYLATLPPDHEGLMRQQICAGARELYVRRARENHPIEVHLLEKMTKAPAPPLSPPSPQREKAGESRGR